METAIGKLVRDLRTAREMSIRELADICGLSHSALQQKEIGKLGISPKDRKVFAKAFSMTLDEFDAQWRASKLDGHERPAPEGIPVINRTPAGLATDYNHDQSAEGEYHDAFEYLERGGIDDPMAFAVVVVGESMQPLLNEGDYVVFTPMNVPRPRATLENGSLVFVRFGGDDTHEKGCTLARWSSDGEMVTLTKDNPAYAPIVVKPENIQRVAVAIQRRSTKMERQ